MQRILRFLLPLAVVALAAVGLAACGGGDSSGEEATSSTDVNTLLNRTFNSKKEIESGKVDLSVQGDVSGSSSGDNGSFTLRLAGPFENEGKTKLPKFDFDLHAQGGGQSIKAGLENTGDRAFVSFQGQEYSVPANVFQQFKAGFEQAAQQSAKNNGKQQSLASLGIDPRQWLTNPKNAGEGKVGDTDVINITGGVDVGRFLDDINRVLEKAGSLGVQNSKLPSKITAEQKQEVEKAVKDVKVLISTGKDDSTLRRMKVDLTAQNPKKASEKVAVAFDLQLLGLNEGQDFPTPSDTKPLNDLLQKFGGLGSLGGALGGGSSSSGSGGSSSSGASQEKIKKYSDCLEQAGKDVSKAQKCAQILTP